MKTTTALLLLSIVAFACLPACNNDRAEGIILQRIYQPERTTLKGYRGNIPIKIEQKYQFVILATNKTISSTQKERLRHLIQAGNTEAIKGDRFTLDVQQHTYARYKAGDYYVSDISVTGPPRFASL